MAKREMLQCGAGVKTFVGKSSSILIVEMEHRKVRAQMTKTKRQQTNRQQ